MDFRKTQAIKVMFSDGTSTEIRGMYPADLHRKYIELKKQDNVVIVEMWHLGDPSYSDPALRYSRLLRAWERGKGDLNITLYRI